MKPKIILIILIWIILLVSAYYLNPFTEKEKVESSTTLMLTIPTTLKTTTTNPTTTTITVTTIKSTSTTIRPDTIRIDAFYAKNPLKCSKLKRLMDRSGCIKDIAVLVEDIRVCNILEYDNHVTDCIIRIANKTENHSICGQIAGIDNMICVKHNAILQENPGLCSEITDKSISNDCLSQMGVFYEKYTYCNIIKDLDARDNCILNLAKKISNLGFCEMILNNTLTKDECIRQVAYNKGYYKDCNNINNEDIRQKCYREIAALNKDETPCMFFIDPVEQITCNAIAKHNLEYCEKISQKRDKKDYKDCIYLTNTSINKYL